MSQPIRRRFLMASGALLAAPLVRAQQTRVARVAWTSVDVVNLDPPFLRALREGLRRLQWDEGRNLALSTWWGGGSVDGLRKRVPDILASRPDVVVAAGGPATRVMIDANVQLPVVFTSSADAVLAKIVESRSRPGGNRTGISFFSLELIPKRLQLMSEVVPGMKRVAMVGWPAHAGELLELEAAVAMAQKLGLAHRYFGVNTKAELMTAFEEIVQWRADAILAFAGAVTVNHAGEFAAFTRQRRIPAFSSWAMFAEAGNIMTHGPVLAECYARLASFVDRILKGVKPGEIPVEQPTTFELVVNLKAANAIGMEIPRSILLRADRTIE